MVLEVKTSKYLFLGGAQFIHSIGRCGKGQGGSQNRWAFHLSASALCNPCFCEPQLVYVLKTASHSLTPMTHPWSPGASCSPPLPTPHLGWVHRQSHSPDPPSAPNRIHILPLWLPSQHGVSPHMSRRLALECPSSLTSLIKPSADAGPRPSARGPLPCLRACDPRGHCRGDSVLAVGPGTIDDFPSHLVWQFYAFTKSPGTSACGGERWVCWRNI